MDINLTARTEEQQIAEISIPKTKEDVVPLNAEAALASYTDEERQEITSLAESIDVRQVDNAMRYGFTPLKTTFDQCGALLKEERGSNADQMVISQVIELSKRASESYDDFNLVLKEPGFIEKILLSLSKNKRKERGKKMQDKAITCYQLIVEFKKSCDSWIEILQKAMVQIEDSGMSDVDTITLLEKYIIAGKMAQERITQELTDVQAKYNETGLQKYSSEYEELKQGAEIFERRIIFLEQARAMYMLSIGQLVLMKRGNINVQQTTSTKADMTMTIISQKIRNAVLNAKTKEVLEGQQAISRLSDELIKEVSKMVGATTTETEKFLYTGVCSIEAAKEAVSTIITTCGEIQKTAEEMLPKLKADNAALNDILKDLEPYIESVTVQQSGTDTPKIGTKSNPTNVGNGLTF